MKIRLTHEQFSHLMPCGAGYQFAEARQFDFAKIFDECPRIDWLLWLMKRVAPLTLEQCLRLSIGFARMGLHKFEAEYPHDSRPRMAILAAEMALAPGQTASTCKLKRRLNEAQFSLAMVGGMNANGNSNRAAWAAAAAAQAAAQVAVEFMGGGTTGATSRAEAWIGEAASCGKVAASLPGSDRIAWECEGHAKMLREDWSAARSQVWEDERRAYRKRADLRAQAEAQNIFRSVVPNPFI